MTSYSDRVLRNTCPLIIETKDRCVYIGYLEVEGNGYRLFPLDHTEYRLYLRRSDIRRAVNLYNWCVLPKENQKRIPEQLDIFEVNELLNKAGYQFM